LRERRQAELDGFTREEPGEARAGQVKE